MRTTIARSHTAARRGQFTRGFTLGGLLGLAAAAAVIVLFPPPRTNVLILGVDRRPGETMVSRTDTLILATFHASRRYVGLLSIPRDLYLTLPGGSTGRINTAHFAGEAAQRGGGPAAAMQTVRSNFGLDVHRYARIDFEGFVGIVDAVGGIYLDVPRPLIDYAFPTDDYGITTVEFQSGPQWMDGQRALSYARIRHGSSDFKRAERQQLVLRALLARLAWPDAWVRLPAAALAARGAIDTDLTPIEVVRLAAIVVLAGADGLDQRVIDENLTQSFITDNGASVLLPRWERINPVLLEMFGQ